MPTTRNPWFRIYRVDDPRREDEGGPECHYRAFWRVAETTYRVKVWTREGLARRPETQVPSQAQAVGDQGWMLLQPIDSTSPRPQQVEGPGGFPPRGLPGPVGPKPERTRTGSSSEDETEPVGS